VECYFQSLMPHEGGAVSYVGDRDGGSVFMCDECGLVFVPKTDPEQYKRLYTDPGRYYHESVSIGYETFPDRFEHDRQIAEVRIKNLRRAIGNNGKPVRVLDVGCGNCALTESLMGEGFNARGVDLDWWSFRQSRAFKLVHTELEHTCGDFIDYDEREKFDAIMFTDSFEHFLYPQSYAGKAERMLNDGGLAVLEMPDTDSEGWRAERIRWRHVKPREHPFLYNEGHVRCLFEDGCGMEVERVIHTIPGRAVYFVRK
jgi:SAM-dependent methyltransferase